MKVAGLRFYDVSRKIHHNADTSYRRRLLMQRSNNEIAGDRGAGA